jgi:hypothetical protein
MASYISNGQPYFASTTPQTTDVVGNPIFCDGLSVATFTFVLNVGAGNVTSTIYFEATSQAGGTVTDWARLLIPAGGLHTNVAGIALSTPVSETMGSLTVTLTAASSGTFMVTLSDLPVGLVRAVYDYGSGTGGAPNTLTCYAAGKG